jgi:hypothetical protein
VGIASALGGVVSVLAFAEGARRATGAKARTERRGGSGAFFAVSISYANSCVALVSLRAPTMRCRALTLIPGRRRCAGLSSPSRGSSRA